MTTTTPSAADLRRTLADQLRETGAIRSEGWYQAFAAVPREVFVPRFAVRTPSGPAHIEPGSLSWLATVYSDDSLLTQFDSNGVPTSSSSQPTLMAVMLEALDVKPDSRVLEVATGTGYNAALLSHRLGSGNVVTIEVDPELARAAETRLNSAGYAPTVIAGDGRAGYPDGGPYDRLIATCGMESIPLAWLDQMKPGGIIVAPLGGGIVRLRVEGDGSASGVFLSDAAYFMPARTLGRDGLDPTAPPPLPSIHDERPCELDPALLLADDVHFPLTLTLSGARTRLMNNVDGGTEAAHLWHEDGSWAEVRGGVARQAGPRQLLDIAEKTLADFEAFGRPARERFRLTVNRNGQWVWPRGSDGPVWQLV